MKVAVLAMLSALLAPVAIAVLPGILISLSVIAVDYVATKILDQVSRTIRGQKIPDQNGSSHVAGGKVKYHLTNMHVTSFTKPLSNVRSGPPDHMNWVMAGGSLRAHGDWRYRYKIGFIPINDNGTFDLDVDDISMATALQFVKDARGEPTILPICSPNIGKVKAKFHGGQSWLFRLFDRKIEKTIQHHLELMLAEPMLNSSLSDDHPLCIRILEWCHR